MEYQEYDEWFAGIASRLADLETVLRIARLVWLEKLRNATGDTKCQEERRSS